MGLMTGIEVDDTEDGEFILTDEERQPCEVFTRVMGYHRPVQYFNIGKKQEHADRKHFRESCELTPLTGA